MSVPLGKYWRSSPLVFVRASLPWRFRIAEVDLHSGVDAELGVLGHFFAVSRVKILETGQGWDLT